MSATDPEAPIAPRSSEWLSFQPSSIHGLGAFASVDLPAGTALIEYGGEMISKEESIRRQQGNNPCIFYLDEVHDLDGAVEWNPARFINHSCAPNCEAVLSEGHIWIVTKRDVAAGEEITFNYGYDLVDMREHPCRCGAPDCVGYIIAEEFFGCVSKMRD